MKNRPTLKSLADQARDAIRDLREAIALGIFNDAEIRTFGDLVDDIIDTMNAYDPDLADKFSDELARLAA